LYGVLDQESGAHAGEAFGAGALSLLFSVYPDKLWQGCGGTCAS